MKAGFSLFSRWSGGGKCASISLLRRGVPQTIVACQNPAPSPQGSKVRIACKKDARSDVAPKSLTASRSQTSPPVNQIDAKLPSLRRVLRHRSEDSAEHVTQSPVFMIKSEQLSLQPQRSIGGYCLFRLTSLGILTSGVSHYS